MIKCKQCGQLIDDSAKFCPKCGVEIQKFSSQGIPNIPNPQGQPFGNQRPPYQGISQFSQEQYTTAPNGMKVRNMDMIEACKNFWTRYAEFDGRSRRSEYWWSQLMLFVISSVLGATIVAPLACLIPAIAISVRRLHDIGKSGWYVLFALIPLVGAVMLIIWACQEGTIGRNQYGEDPKYIA